MNDTIQWKHGEEGTHSVCNKHNIGGKSVCCECSKKDDCGETNTIATIMNELKKRRNWNNPQEVEIWFEKKLREVEAKATAEEKQLSYNEGVEDARLAVCSVEKNIWEKYVYLRIDKIFELLKKLTKKD